jgi:hypothetical protein
MANPRATLEITASDETKRGLSASLASFKRFGSEVEARGRRIGASLQGAFDRLGGATGLSLGLAGLGAAFGKAVTDSIQFADSIDQASTKLGVGTERLSALAFAAEQSDVALQDLSSSLIKLQLATGKAEGGNKQLLETFRALGIDFEKFKALSVDVQFKEVAESISRLQRDADRTRGSVELFGESGAKLLPLFKEGAAGIQQLEQRAKDLGLALGPEAIERILAADEAMKAFNASLQGLKFTLAQRAGPFLGELADGVRTLLGGATEIEKLTDKIEFLERMRGRIVVNFGLLDGAGLFVTPSEVEQQITSLGKALEELQAKGKASTVSVAAAPPGFAPPEEVTVKAKRLGANEFADSELRAALADRSRSLDAVFEANRARYENEAQILGELDRNLAESSAAVFEQNSEEIAGYLDRMERDTLDTLEVQTGLFEGFGQTIESSLSDAFAGASDGARGFADSVLNSFKRILADKAASELTGLLGGLFGAKKDPGVGGSAGGGVLSSALGALFGGFKAEGGPLTQGKWHIAGEKGPEPIWGGGPGAFAVGYKQMAGLQRMGTVNVNNNVTIDARGATQDGMKVLMAQLPEILKKNRQQTIAEIKDMKGRGNF